MVPAALAATQRLYFGAAGDRWVAGLPQLAETWLERWALTPDGPPASGAVALVLPVRRADGTPAALKLQPVDQETAGEGTALRLWAGRGAVALLAHDEASGTLLLERLDASRTLLSPDVPDREASTVVAGLLVRLNAVPAPAGLRRLADVAGETLASVPAALAAATDAGERALLGTAAGLLGELLAEPVGDRLLHWDLHHSNVLATLEHRDWRAIDPKPLAGDPGFELLPALWNRWDAVLATGDVAAGGPRPLRPDDRGDGSGPAAGRRLDAGPRPAGRLLGPHLRSVAHDLGPAPRGGRGAAGTGPRVGVTDRSPAGRRGVAGPV